MQHTCSIKLQSQSSDLKFAAICMHSQLWSGPQPEMEIDYEEVFLSTAVNNHTTMHLDVKFRQRKFRGCYWTELLVREAGQNVMT